MYLLSLLDDVSVVVVAHDEVVDEVAEQLSVKMIVCFQAVP